MLTMLTTLALAQPAVTPEVLEAPAVPEAPAVLVVPAAPVMPASIVTTPADTLDFFGFDETLSVSERIPDNAFMMARELGIDAPIGGDVFGMGESVVIDKPVSGDVYVMAASLVVTETGSIGGSLNVFAGELTLRGPVAGSVSAQVGEVLLASDIGGDLGLATERMTIESTAHIAGDLDYTSPAKFPALEQAAAGTIEHSIHDVAADVNFDIDLDAEEDEESSMLSQAVWWTGMRGWGFLTKFLVGSLLFLLGGQWLAAAGRRIGSSPARSLGAGFVTAGVLPIISTGALMLVIPFPLGLLGFTLLGVLLYVGQLFAAQALGDFLLHRLRPEAVGNPYISLAVGLVPLMLLFAMPYIGTMAWFTATLLGIGGLVAALRNIR